jgi:hypothetical protein
MTSRGLQPNSELFWSFEIKVEMWITNLSLFLHISQLIFIIETFGHKMLI